jgi:hypothetical protein
MAFLPWFDSRLGLHSDISALIFHNFLRLLSNQTARFDSSVHAFTFAIADSASRFWFTAFV